MVKTFKNLLWNRLSYVAETLYTASGTHVLYTKVCSYDDPRLTFDIFMHRSTLVSYVFCMGKRLNGGFLKVFKSMG